MRVSTVVLRFVLQNVHIFLLSIVLCALKSACHVSPEINWLPFSCVRSLFSKTIFSRSTAGNSFFSRNRHRIILLFITPTNANTDTVNPLRILYADT